ncbi:MAG: stage III sporulation protein AD [Limnochordia bacterium]|jgi:stage III sporulation protein AD|nr:stage III sporulation protein AD [Limnochordia bacterium]
MAQLAKVIGLGVVVTLLMTFFKKQSSEYAVAANVAVVLVIFLFMLQPLGQVIELFRQLSHTAQMSDLYLGIVIRAIAMAYLAGLGAQVSKDAGSESIAGMIELAGKVMILILALPVVAGILDAILGILP